MSLDIHNSKVIISDVDLLILKYLIIKIWNIKNVHNHIARIRKFDFEVSNQLSYISYCTWTYELGNPAVPGVFPLKVNLH